MQPLIKNLDQHSSSFEFESRGHKFHFFDCNIVSEDNKIIYVNGRIQYLKVTPLEIKVSVAGYKSQKVNFNNLANSQDCIFSFSLPVIEYPNIFDSDLNLLLTLRFVENEEIVFLCELPWVNFVNYEEVSGFSKRENYIDCFEINNDSSIRTGSAFDLIEKYAVKNCCALVSQFRETPSVPDILAYLKQNREQIYLEKKSLEEKHQWRTCVDYSLNQSFEYSKKKIALVVSSVAGLDPENVCSIFYFRLAHLLAEEGHDVTILHAPLQFKYTSRNEELEYWTNYFSSKKISFQILPKLSLMLEGHMSVQYSFESFLWLNQNNFDVIHFNAEGGLGYYSTLFKKLKLAFLDSLIIVRGESNKYKESLTSWHLPNCQEDLEIRFLERKSIENSDIAFTHSHGMFDWMNCLGWQLPNRSFYLPHIVSGKVESPKKLDKNTVTLIFNPFLGNKFNSILRLISKIDTSKRKNLRILTSEISYDQNLLKQLEEIAFNSGIPLKIYQGLTPTEMVDKIVTANNPTLIFPEENYSTFLFDSLKSSNVVLLAMKGSRTSQFNCNSQMELQSAILKLFSTEFQVESSHHITNDRQLWLQLQQEKSVSEEPKVTDTPLVSICIPTFNRSNFLAQALESISDQSYRNVEVIVCDDGSKNDDVREEIKSLVSKFSRLKIKLIFQDNFGPGAARNVAAANAEGKYVFFLDDDNLLKKQSLSSMVNIAELNSLDVVTSSLSLFHGEHAPREEDVFAQMLFLGPCISAGYLRNVFGDTFGLIRKSCFYELGGFDVNPEASHEDWELYSRLSLLGYKMEHVPISLGWYRSSQSSHFHRSNGFYSQLQSLSPFKKRLTKIFQDLIDFSQNLHNLHVWRTWFTVPLFESPTEILERKFLYSDKVLFKLNSVNELTELANCKIEEDLPSIKITAENTDPQILLPEINLPRKFRLIAEIDISVPKDTVVQMFYLTHKDDYHSEVHTSLRSVKSGRNKIYIPYEEKELHRSIRFDPGFNAGTYYLHSLEIREVTL